MTITKNILKSKGWSKKEILDTQKIISKADVHATTQITLYWIIILCMSVMVLFVSAWLLPLFVVIEGAFLLFISFLLGLVFGGAMHNLIAHLEHLETHHYYTAGLIIPVVAMLSFYFTSKAASAVSGIFQIPTIQAPLDVGLLFILGFLLPYVYGIVYSK